MEDAKTQALKANYNQEVTKFARETYLKMQEIVRDVSEAKIKEEDKNEIRLHIIEMLLK
jgi:hypothetical protein